MDLERAITVILAFGIPLTRLRNSVSVISTIRDASQSW